MRALKIQRPNCISRKSLETNGAIYSSTVLSWSHSPFILAMTLLFNFFSPWTIDMGVYILGLYCLEA